MPISTDTTRMSIEFIYEYQTPDGPVLQYQMKFQHTPFGPIVQVTQAPYEPVELPADMFTEVAQFLASQGAIRKIPVIGNSPAAQASVSSAVPLPSIGRKMTVSAQQQPVSNISQETAEQAAKFQLSEEEQEALNKQRLEAKAKAAKAAKPFHSAHKAGAHKPKKED